MFMKILLIGVCSYARVHYYYPTTYYPNLKLKYSVILIQYEKWVQFYLSEVQMFLILYGVLLVICEQGRYTNLKLVTI